jgi:hypothetical protein
MTTEQDNTNFQAFAKAWATYADDDITLSNAALLARTIINGLPSDSKDNTKHAQYIFTLILNAVTRSNSKKHSQNDTALLTLVKDSMALLELGEQNHTDWLTEEHKKQLTKLQQKIGQDNHNKSTSQPTTSTSDLTKQQQKHNIDQIKQGSTFLGGRTRQATLSQEFTQKMQQQGHIAAAIYQMAANAQQQKTTDILTSLTTAELDSTQWALFITTLLNEIDQQAITLRSIALGTLKSRPDQQSDNTFDDDEFQFDSRKAQKTKLPSPRPATFYDTPITQLIGKPRPTGTPRKTNKQTKEPEIIIPWNSDNFSSPVKRAGNTAQKNRKKTTGRVVKISLSGDPTDSASEHSDDARVLPDDTDSSSTIVSYNSASNNLAVKQPTNYTSWSACFKKFTKALQKIDNNASRERFIQTAKPALAAFGQLLLASIYAAGVILPTKIYLFGAKIKKIILDIGYWLATGAFAAACVALLALAERFLRALTIPKNVISHYQEIVSPLVPLGKETLIASGKKALTFALKSPRLTMPTNSTALKIFAGSSAIGLVLALMLFDFFGLELPRLKRVLEQKKWRDKNKEENKEDNKKNNAKENFLGMLTSGENISHALRRVFFLFAPLATLGVTRFYIQSQITNFATDFPSNSTVLAPNYPGTSQSCQAYLRDNATPEIAILPTCLIKFFEAAAQSGMFLDIDLGMTTKPILVALMAIVLGAAFGYGLSSALQYLVVPGVKRLNGFISKKMSTEGYVFNNSNIIFLPIDQMSESATSFSSDDSGPLSDNPTQ